MSDVTFEWSKSAYTGHLRLNNKFRLHDGAAAVEAFADALSIQLERQGEKRGDILYLLGLASVMHSEKLNAVATGSPRRARPRRGNGSGRKRNGHAGRRPAAD